MPLGYAATTDIADNCGANQLSCNVNFSNANLVLQQQASAASSLAVCLTSPSYEPAALHQRQLLEHDMPGHTQAQQRKGSVLPMQCKLSNQNRMSHTAGTSRTWAHINAGTLVHDHYRQFWTVLEGALMHIASQSLLHWRVIARR